MRILGYMGSPRVNGLNAQIIDSALKGAQSKGAETKKYDLIKCNIKYCLGCHKCVFENYELPIGKCSIKDDMAGILEDYVRSDGYIFASPVYDLSITALMKTFIERKFPLFFKKTEVDIPNARVPANFLKKASMFVTGNARDEYKEVMGPPCFEAMEYDLIIEQVDTVDKLYVGGALIINKEIPSKTLNEAFTIGARLVNEIEKAQKKEGQIIMKKFLITESKNI